MLYGPETESAQVLFLCSSGDVVKRFLLCWWAVLVALLSWLQVAVPRGWTVRTVHICSLSPEDGNSIHSTYIHTHTHTHTHTICARAHTHMHTHTHTHTPRTTYTHTHTHTHYTHTTHTHTHTHTHKMLFIFITTRVDEDFMLLNWNGYWKRHLEYWNFISILCSFF